MLLRFISLPPLQSTCPGGFAFKTQFASSNSYKTKINLIWTLFDITTVDGKYLNLESGNSNLFVKLSWIFTDREIFWFLTILRLWWIFLFQCFLVSYVFTFYLFQRFFVCDDVSFLRFLVFYIVFFRCFFVFNASSFSMFVVFDASSFSMFFIFDTSPFSKFLHFRHLFDFHRCLLIIVCV